MLQYQLEAIWMIVVNTLMYTSIMTMLDDVMVVSNAVLNSVNVVDIMSQLVIFQSQWTHHRELIIVPHTWKPE